MNAWTEQLTKVVSMASLIIGVIAAWYALPLDKEIKALQVETVRLDNALRLSEAEIKKLEVSRQLSIQLYKEVKDVLSRKEHNAREEEAVRVLVDSLAENPFRWKLLEALAIAATDPEVKAKAEATATFFKEEDQIPTIPEPLPANTESNKAYGSIKVDIFFCERGGTASKALADSALTLRTGVVNGRWQIRSLPEEINSRPGYNIRENLIRYNPDEKLAATALQADLKSKLKVDIKIMEIPYPTPNYLSVFFCT